MDSAVLRITIASCGWSRDLVIKDERNYDRPVITFFNAVFIDGIWDAIGKRFFV